MEKLGLTGFLTLSLIMIAGLVGYVINIIKIFALFDCALGVEAVFRIVAVFVFPLGSILGWVPSGGC